MIGSESIDFFYPVDGGKHDILEEVKAQSFPSVYLQTQKPSKVPYYEVTYKDSEKYLCYFHGNGYSTLRAQTTLIMYSVELKINVLGFEYPGYGDYQPAKPSVPQIELDSQNFMKHLTQERKIELKNLYLFGYSIGTCNACYIGSLYKVGGIVLQAPLTSFRDFQSHIYKNKQPLDEDYGFNNLKTMPRITSSILIIHGKADRLVPCSMGQQLFATVPPNIQKTLVLPPEADHSSFDYEQDIIKPVLTLIYNQATEINK